MVEEHFELNEELISIDEDRHEHVILKKKNSRFLQILKLSVFLAAIVAVAVAAFTSGWFISWFTNDTIRNKMQEGSWAVSHVDDSKAKLFTPVMEIGDAEVQVIYSTNPGGRTFVEGRDISEVDNDNEEMGDRTILKDPITKKPVFIVDREFVRDLPMGKIIDESGDLTDESFRFTIIDVATNDRAEIIPFSVSLKESIEEEFAPMDVGENPTFYFQWNNNSRALLKSNENGEMELVWPVSTKEISKADAFLERFVQLYEPFVKAQRALSLNDEDIYIPPSEDPSGEYARAISENPRRNFEVNVAGEKRTGWYLKGNCWVTLCRPVFITKLVKVTSRNACGLWLTISKWVITLVPSKCHQCSRCNLKCQGYPSSSRKGCSDRGKCVRGSCQCDPGFAGKYCTTCAARYDSTTYPNCNKCLPKYSGNRCLDCADGYMPIGLCTCKRMCHGKYFDDPNVCSGHGKCASMLLIFSTCVCNRGWAGSKCNSCASGFVGDDCQSCKKGYTGDKCNVKYNCGTVWAGKDNVCNGNGECIAHGNVGKCSCKEGWGGEYCATRIFTCDSKAPTDPTVCSGRGSCVAQDTCSCLPEYKGANCEKKKQCEGVDFDAPEVCSGPTHGTCNVTVTVPKCDCKPGWTGNDCSIPLCNNIPQGHENVCNKRGACDSPDHCTCNPNYFGSDCQDTLTCNGVDYDKGACVHGTCNGTTKVGTCYCHDNWGGSDCSIHMCDGVLSTNETVCHGHGECVAPNSCNCKDYFKEPYCREEVLCGGLPHDAANVCNHKGSCKTDGTCSCIPGVGGDLCTKCENPKHDYAKNCTTCVPPFTQEGYPACEECPAGFVPPNKCDTCADDHYPESNTCIACECSPQGSKFVNCTNGQCFCKDGFDGPKCDSCRAGTYLKNGECVACNCGPGAVNANCNCKGKCTCDSFHTGEKCEIKRSCFGFDYDKLDKVCGGHGNCTAQDVCSCNGNWAGLDCTTAICDNIEAGPGACNNHGTCIAPDVCDCDPRYGGDFCKHAMKCNDIKFDAVGTVCSGQGDCVGDFNNPRCECTTPGVIGTNCEQCVNPRRVFPTCTTVCKPEFSGADCEDCADGYYADGSSCKKCECDLTGSVNEKCENGVCKCKDQRYGNKCELTCQCNSLGSNTTNCNQETGVCRCIDGWSDDHCNTPRTCNNVRFDLLNTTCSGHGKCVDQDVCECNEGYEGEFCDKESVIKCFGIPSTDPEVCSRNGKCYSTDECTCDPGFTGDNCQDKELMCFGKTGDAGCNFNGKCVEEDVCECKNLLYTGKDCGTSLAFADGSTTYKWPSSMPSPGFVFANEFTTSDVFTWYFVLEKAEFHVLYNGFDMGLVSFPLVTSDFHNLGRGSFEWGYCSVDGFVYLSRETGSFVDRQITEPGQAYKFVLDNRGPVFGTVSLYRRLPGETEFHPLGSQPIFPGVRPQTGNPNAKLRIAFSARCTGDCQIRFMDQI